MILQSRVSIGAVRRRRTNLVVKILEISMHMVAFISSTTQSQAGNGTKFPFLRLPEEVATISLTQQSLHPGSLS